MKISYALVQIQAHRFTQGELFLFEDVEHLVPLEGPWETISELYLSASEGLLDTDNVMCQDATAVEFHAIGDYDSGYPSFFQYLHDTVGIEYVIEDYRSEILELLKFDIGANSTSIITLWRYWYIDDPYEPDERWEMLGELTSDISELI